MPDLPLGAARALLAIVGWAARQLHAKFTLALRRNSAVVFSDWSVYSRASIDCRPFSDFTFPNSIRVGVTGEEVNIVFRARSFTGIVLVSVAVGSGCSGDRLVGVHDDVVPNEPRMSGSSGFDFDFDLAPSNSTEGVGPVTIGSYSEATLVEVHATGIRAYYKSQWAGWYSGVGDYVGHWDAAGIGGPAGCRGHVQIRGSLQGAVGPCDIWNTANGSWRVLGVLKGTVTARWIPGPPSQAACNGQLPPYGPCFNFGDGSYAGTVTRIPAEHTLSSPPAVPPATSVTFSTAATPTRLKIFPDLPNQTAETVMPYTVKAWRFRRESGQLQSLGYLPGPGTNPVWKTFTPISSGYLEIEALVNGVLETQRKNISVANNPITCESPVLKEWWPISSQFGKRRPSGPHMGRDIASPTGNPVFSPTGGVVLWDTPLASTGKTLVVEDAAGYRYYYYHLSQIVVVKGETVTAGSLLGHTGNTGTASEGPHLHFQMHRPGGPVWLPRGHPRAGKAPRETVVQPCFW